MTNSLDWPHAPVHRLAAHGTYMVTASTANRAHVLTTSERLDVMQRGLLKLAKKHGWQIEAWAIFSNHYHFVGHSPPDGAETLPVMLRELHSKMTIWLNRRDSISGRTVWNNYWETLLDILGSYLARLNYVHQNPVRHGLVNRANQYPWSSAGWFEKVATTAQVQTIYRIKLDRVKVLDDFDVVGVAQSDGAQVFPT